MAATLPDVQPPKRPKTHSLHCSTSSCRGVILAVVPRAASGYLRIYCSNCRRWSEFTLAAPAQHRLVEAFEP